MIKNIKIKYMWLHIFKICMWMYVNLKMYVIASKMIVIVSNDYFWTLKAEQNTGQNSFHNHQD